MYLPALVLKMTFGCEIQRPKSRTGPTEGGSAWARVDQALNALLKGSQLALSCQGSRPSEWGGLICWSHSGVPGESPGGESSSRWLWMHDVEFEMGHTGGIKLFEYDMQGYRGRDEGKASSKDSIQSIVQSPPAEDHRPPPAAPARCWKEVRGSAVG